MLKFHIRAAAGLPAGDRALWVRAPYITATSSSHKRTISVADIILPQIKAFVNLFLLFLPGFAGIWGNQRLTEFSLRKAVQNWQ